MRKLLTGNAAAAWAARLAEVDYVPAFPITPQTEIIELLAQWADDGELDGRFVSFDSEHSMLTAAAAASAAGARVFTATSSQGLLYGFEVLYMMAGFRAPLVVVNVSRGLSSPITLEADHNDVLSARDSGFLQIHTETCQEVLDSILLAYRISESAEIKLPSLVNLDGFTLSFTREPVEMPDPSRVREFLPGYAPDHAFIRGDRPMAQGIAVLGGSAYSYFRYQLHLAQRRALDVFESAAREFEAIFGRRYGVFESYQMDDAEVVLVMSNALATKGKAAVRRMRERGLKAGLLKLRLLRPFPGEAIAAALRGRRAVAVLDQNLAPGQGGITFPEIATALYPFRDRPALLSVVGGLGGKNLSDAELDSILDKLTRAAVAESDAEAAMMPLLLYTADERARMETLLRIAGKEIPA